MFRKLTYIPISHTGSALVTDFEHINTRNWNRGVTEESSKEYLANIKREELENRYKEALYHIEGLQDTIENMCKFFGSKLLTVQIICQGGYSTTVQCYDYTHFSTGSFTYISEDFSHHSRDDVKECHLIAN